MIFTYRVLLTVIVVSVLASAARGQREPAAASHPVLRLPVTRDAWVSEVGAEADGNNGGAPRLKLKSIQEMSLVDIETKSLAGRTIVSAALYVRKAGDEPLRRVTVSSVAAQWYEGTASNYATQPGGVTFRHRRHPDLPWSIGGGDLTHVVLGNGGTTWRMADATPPDASGWQRIPVDPKVIAARSAGLSHGFLLFDDTGSEWTRAGEKFTFRLFPNRFVYSRDQNPSSAPYFTVELGPDDHAPPSAPSGVRVEPLTARLPAGEALVSWVTPRDVGPAGTLGFLVALDGRALPRELIPLAGEPGARVEMHLRDLKLAPGASANLSIQAVDAAGNRGPSTRAGITLSSRLPAALPEPMPGARPPHRQPAWPRVAGAEVAILDELDKVHPQSGEMIPPHPEGYRVTNHLWDAAERTITLQAARNEFVAFQILLRGKVPAASIRPELVFSGPAARTVMVALGRYHLVESKLGPLPDPIVPIDFPAGASSGTKYQSLHIEVYVPHALAPGEYRGVLSLRGPAPGARDSSRQDEDLLQLPVMLRVWDFSLPDHLSFLPEMNCYALPENERDYYRLAHRHRTVLNRLPYYQNGRIADGCAPRWDSNRQDLDWSAWDRRFGPLLDGSAFADLPRKSVPVESFYLPLHENWPSPMEGNYNGDYWADRAFPESYRRAFVVAARQIAVHIQARRWTETLFEGFLNNKNNFKENGWSRGSSPWLLDEPASFQDYWALRYFARAFHTGINQARDARLGLTGISSKQGRPPSSSSSSSTETRLAFRADISRPQWRRDSLDGLLDCHVVGSTMRSYPRLVFERKRTLGEIVFEYGSTNPIEESNVQPAAWCLDAWSLGADGIIPWQTIGTEESWRRSDELALLYPGRRVENPAQANAVSPPFPSIRLKAYRRGQQDVEYLQMWSQLRDEPRWAVGQQVRAALKLAGTRQATGVAGAEDAGRMEYGRLEPRDLWSLRTMIGEALSKAHPPAKSKLVEFRTPRRDPNHLAPAFVEEQKASDERTQPVPTTRRINR
jgi:hypothetical protein